MLPRRVGLASHARLHLALGLQFDHVCGKVGNRVLDGVLLFGPIFVANFGQHRLPFGPTDVFLHQVDFGCRCVKFGAAMELQFKVLGQLSFLLQHLQTAEPPDTM